MTSRDWTHWGALALAIGVVVFAIFRVVFLVLTGETSLGLVRATEPPDASELVLVTTGLILVGIAGWIFGILALLARYWPASSRTGRVGLAILSAGTVMVVASHASIIPFAITGRGGLLRGLIWDSSLVMNIGLIVFGIAAIRNEILPKWRFLPAATGIAGFLFLINLAAPTPVFFALRGVFATGWLLLAYLLWIGTGSTVQRPAAEVVEV